MSWIGQAWRGETRLAKVFWVYGILFSLLLNIVSYATSAIFDTGTLFKFWAVPFLIVTLIYSVWLTVAQWRCAFNVRNKIWGYLVRIYTILWLVVTLAIIVSVGFTAGFMAARLHDTMPQMIASVEQECAQEMQNLKAQNNPQSEKLLEQCFARVADKAFKPHL